ncbi:MAG: hypothetical protein WCV99_19505 [Sterolibacterium sp.]
MFAFTRSTASSVNSGAYSRFGTFFNFFLPSNLPGRYTPFLGHEIVGEAHTQCRVSANPSVVVYRTGIARILTEM